MGLQIFRKNPFIDCVSLTSQIIHYFLVNNKNSMYINCIYESFLMIKKIYKFFYYFLIFLGPLVDHTQLYSICTLSEWIAFPYIQEK